MTFSLFDNEKVEMFVVAVDIKINDFRSFHLECLKMFPFSTFELTRLKALVFIRNFVWP